MAATRPLHATAIPSEDFYLNYDSEEASSKMQGISHPRIPIRRLAVQHRSHVPWQDAADLVINVSGLPCDVTVLELKKMFEIDGDIKRIDIHREEDLINKTITAAITFSPAPEGFNAYRNRGCILRHDERSSEGFTYQVHVEIEGTKIQSMKCPTSRQQFHPEHIVMSAESVEFGFYYDSNDIRIMDTATTSDANKTSLTLNTQRREILLRFSSASGADESGIYKLQVPLQYIEQIFSQRAPARLHIVDLIIPLGTPPALYQLRPIPQTMPDKLDDHWSETQQWQRVTRINSAASPKNEAISLPMLNGRMNLGTWTTYRVRIDLTKLSPGLLGAFQAALRDYNVGFLQAPRHLKITSTPVVSCWSWLSLSDMRYLDGSSHLPWEVRYQLEVCISQGLLSEYKVSQDFVAELAAMGSDRAVQLLEYVANKNKRMHQPADILKLKTPALASSTRMPRQCVLLRQATVTPLTVYFTSPTVEMSNRVLRHFSGYADRFLRVRFSDEKTEGRLWSSVNGSSDPLYDRIKRCITHGIMIGDRHYEYLASGNSQFREHGAYFFSSTSSLRAADIRSWIGDLRDIKTVSKYMSRMGQGFSTTRAIHGTKVVIKEDSDVSRNGHTFTDGVGKISLFLAQSIAIELGFPNPSQPPSLFQFRLGGCKGVLALWPTLAKAREIHIRPSQYKFSAVHDGLEIIRCSSFASADLNRQLITCLTTLGVPDRVFLQMLQRQLLELRLAMRDGDKACKMLTQRADTNQITLELAELIRRGFVVAREPFVMSLLHLWRAWSLKKLKDKARISIDQAAFVLGCTDETGTLIGHFDSQASADLLLDTREAHIAALPQIYLRLSTFVCPGKYCTITGPCIVARNPSLHPGDIRIVNAVDNPLLSHLKDVVVFPQTGDRDIPSMCSGGDLDGDDFLVLWDPDLLPPMHMWNVPPMDFTGATPVTKQSIEIEDCADFFVNHMKHDNLGRIANAWQAISDASPAKAADPRCHRLAALHSTAVDFPKTGVPAVLPADLVPKQYSHFMPSKFRPKSRIYQSKSVLGKIYDEVEGFEYRPTVAATAFDQRILAADLQGRAPDVDNVDPLRSLDSEKDERSTDSGAVAGDTLRDRITLIKAEYDAGLRRIMAQHDIGTEFEVWSGFVLSHNQATGDYKFHETIGELAGSLKEQFRAACVDVAHKILSSSVKLVSNQYHKPETAVDETPPLATPASGQDKKQDTYDAMATFVQAMYRTTQHEVKLYDSLTPIEKSNSLRPLISFPWLFADYLGRMAVDNPMPETLISTTSDLQPHSVLGRGTLGIPGVVNIPTMPRAMRMNGGLQASKHSLSVDPHDSRVPLPASARALVSHTTQKYSTADKQALLIDLAGGITDSDDVGDGKLIDISEDKREGDESNAHRGVTCRGDLLDLFTDIPQSSSGTEIEPLQDLPFARAPASSWPVSVPANASLTSKPVIEIPSQQTATEEEVEDLASLFSRKLSLSPSNSVSAEVEIDGLAMETDDGSVPAKKDTVVSGIRELSNGCSDDDGGDDGSDGSRGRDYEHRPRYDEEAMVLSYD